MSAKETLSQSPKSRYLESDSKLVDRMLAREVQAKRNILLMNHEAHHAYRIRRNGPDEGEADLFGDTDHQVIRQECGLGFAISDLHNDDHHKYVTDLYLVREALLRAAITKSEG